MLLKDKATYQAILQTFLDTASYKETAKRHGLTRSEAYTLLKKETDPRYKKAHEALMRKRNGKYANRHCPTCKRSFLVISMMAAGYCGKCLVRMVYKHRKQESVGKEPPVRVPFDKKAYGRKYWQERVRSRYYDERYQQLQERYAKMAAISPNDASSLAVPSLSARQDTPKTKSQATE